MLQKELVGAAVTVGDSVLERAVVIVCVIVNSSERVAVKEACALKEVVTVDVIVLIIVLVEQRDGS